MPIAQRVRSTITDSDACRSVIPVDADREAVTQ
jgi:hypothetical protein